MCANGIFCQCVLRLLEMERNENTQFSHQLATLLFRLSAVDIPYQRIYKVAGN